MRDIELAHRYLNLLYSGQLVDYFARTQPSGDAGRPGSARRTWASQAVSNLALLGRRDAPLTLVRARISSPGLIEFLALRRVIDALGGMIQWLLKARQHQFEIEAGERTITREIAAHTAVADRTLAAFEATKNRELGVTERISALEIASRTADALEGVGRIEASREVLSLARSVIESSLDREAGEVAIEETLKRANQASIRVARRTEVLEATTPELGGGESRESGGH